MIIENEYIAILILSGLALWGWTEVSKSDSKKREHWVRGHFREVEGHSFIPDGLYFIKSHQRGSSVSGIIRKDYRISDPQPPKRRSSG